MQKIFFTRTTGGLPHHTYVYTMGGALLQEVDRTWDLRILINRAVTFKKHIAQIIQKSKRLLGFIIQNSVNFKTRTLEVLYYSLVRSNLESGSLVWNPSSQKRFLKYLYYELFHYYPINTEYRDLLRGFEYLSCETRWKVTMLLFRRDVIKGRITEPNMLSKVNINVSRQNSRFRKAFRPPVMQASILRLSILGLASEIYSSISRDPGLHLHHQSREEFKQSITDLIGG